jgi:putative glutamine amidotransferase
VPERQRVFDDALLQSALERRIPVLGICYGAQLIALRHGGSLHHHIPLDVSDACNHQLTESTARHAIDVAPDSRLAALLGRRRVEVNSLHHQAIAEPGSGFRVVANAADGIVEAIECEADAFTIGVQWHPEKLDGPAGENLFKALVGACSRE